MTRTKVKKERKKWNPKTSCENFSNLIHLEISIDYDVLLSAEIFPSFDCFLLEINLRENGENKIERNKKNE